MRKAIGFPSLILAISSISHAQQPAAKSAHKAVAKSVAEYTDAAISSQLPVTRVALYKNGVGFFEHDGHVTGDQSVTINFTTEQLNDVLQSLTAIDLNGGRIAGAGYNSTTPLDQQLKELPLALPEKTTFSVLFNALRGTRVEVTGSGAPFTGRLVDEEMHKTGPGKDQVGMLEGRFITVAADSGEVRIFQLTPSLSVHLLDTAAHTDLTQYLQVLDSNRNSGLRHLTLQDSGTGTRELHVSYISEVPIWKSTYRILFTEPKATDITKTQTATLQGWSVVDNTTGTDWLNVKLSLIAGAPQSFIQPLSIPYYSRRPEIGLPQEAQLTPQTHESGEDGKVAKVPPAPVAMDGMALANELGSGSGGNYGGALAQRLRSSNQTVTVTDAPTIENETYQNLALNSVAPKTSTAAFDDYFAYNLTEPITIRKNESALVPILQTKIDAERVTLWSQQQPTPLRALWITNTSNLTLDRGSFSIVEDGNFGGEGLLDPIHPAEKRLLSYAVDQAIHVTTESQHNTAHATELTAAKGVLILRRTDTAEITYVVHNAATDGRTVIIEHPIRQGYTLDSDPKPEETTSTLYRYRVNAGPGETVHLHVGEKHNGTVSYQLTNFSDSQLTYILNQTGNSATIKQALQPVLDARRHVADMQSVVDKVNDKLNTLRSDEDRQRSNITALASADKDSRGRFVHDLNATEDQIAAAQKELATAETNLQAAKDDLANKIESLQIDEKL